jgi:uncharacterized protein YabE (DUF348 family)
MIPIAKNIKRYFSLKVITVVIPVMIILVSAWISIYADMQKDVAVYYDGKLTEIKTMKTTVQEVLAENKILVNHEDYINLPLDSKLQKKNKNEIFIKKAVPVNIVADGKVMELKTYKNTVGEVLENSPLKLEPKDKLNHLTPGDKIISNMEIRIIRVKEEQVKEKIQIPFKTVTNENNKMDVGAVQVVKQGKMGLREKVYNIVLEDGKEVARSLLKEYTVLEPVTRIMEHGTVLSHKTARGEVIRYSKVLNVRASAYSLSFEDTGKRSGDKYFGITATGMDITKIKKGVIAVDPRVIPLGSKVYVEISGKTPDYGFAIASDIGGGIKRDKIDLFFSDTSITENWGSKKAKVYILIK